MLAAPYLAEFGGSQKGQSLISAYQSLAITTNSKHPRIWKAKYGSVDL